MIGVSCICLTFARPKLLEEAIESFLKQDYEGPHELIVLNDFDKQILECDVDDVWIHNEQPQYGTLGKKRNIACGLARFKYLMQWDDDDISFPNRISQAVEGIGNADAFWPRRMIHLKRGTL